MAVGIGKAVDYEALLNPSEAWIRPRIHPGPGGILKTVWGRWFEAAAIEPRHGYPRIDRGGIAAR